MGRLFCCLAPVDSLKPYWQVRYHLDGMMNVLYPATSEERICLVCEKLTCLFDLPESGTIHRSEYLESARSRHGRFEITVTEYLLWASSEQPAQVGPPDHWHWRLAVSPRFNYQVAIAGAAFSRNQRRSITRKLRTVFPEIRLHGDPV
jgi:hypothetical protein